MKFSDEATDWLAELGYTHCFFVPGGNSMHLLDSARTRMQCVAFTHEVSATIAAEYFNEIAESELAYVLLTAGPGLTNAVTGIAGAFLENRELLVVGGQVKSSDLSDGKVRQRGIQEIDGVAIASPVTIEARQLQTPIPKAAFVEIVEAQWRKTPGPVFIEICLDAQAGTMEVAPDRNGSKGSTRNPTRRSSQSGLEASAASEILTQLRASSRPVLLIGGGVKMPSREVDAGVRRLRIPAMTTYNGADRIGSNNPYYFGRPNTWGMRHSNILLGQADLIIAVGTRLGLQQTGFNWEQWAPLADVVQVDLSEAELAKGHPRVDSAFRADAATVLSAVFENSSDQHADWTNFCRSVKDACPLSETSNSRHEGFHNPYDFLLELSAIAEPTDLVVPSSSGSAFTAFYQAFENKVGQRIVSNKSLAAMGYGQAGAIGAALAGRGRRVLHVEGDGSILQNIQEIATASVRSLNIKTFLWDNDGYASIRMTQRNYFGGTYLGCDPSSGLGFPDWTALASSFGISSRELAPGFSSDNEMRELMKQPGPCLFVCRLHPEQTYFPKISSRITESGGMESEPLWDISPHLDSNARSQLLRYLVDSPTTARNGE